MTNNNEWEPVSKNVPGYHVIHEWVKQRFTKPAACVQCLKPESFGKDGRSLLDLANISGKYKRDLTDWKWLCRKCHMAFDKSTSKRQWANGRNCKRGHLLTPENTYVKNRTIGSRRQCKKCAAAGSLARYHRAQQRTRLLGRHMIGDPLE